MELVEINKNDFDKEANKYTCKNFFQTSYMGTYLEGKGKVYCLALKNEKKIVGVALINEEYTFLGKKHFNCLKGFLTDYSNEELVKTFISKLKEFVINHNGFGINISPYIETHSKDIDGNDIEGVDNSSLIKLLASCGLKKLKYDVNVKTVFCTDINNMNEEELFSTFKQNTRNLIHRAEKMGVEIQNLEYDDLPRFSLITNYTCIKRHIKDKSLEYYQNMYKCFGDKVVYKIARLNVDKYKKYLKDLKEDYDNKLSKLKGESPKKKNYEFELSNVNKKIEEAKEFKVKYIDLACAMFMLYGDETVYLFSGSYDKYNEFAGQYLIQWDIFKYAIKTKKRRHNFFGVLNYTDKKDENYGVYLFKRGFGGYIEELIGEYELIINNFSGIAYKIKKLIRR